ncbi:MAG: hypothetical protein M3Q66_07500 [Chloroflexota bacterium]|nr:hypothetical protein [Chloroflexota bacterium]
MEEQDVRGRAEALCTALVSGDIETATADFSAELRQNLGEVIALLPLPVTEATVDSIERGGSSAFVAILNLVGEAETVQVQTRWKDRDGAPTVIEASHLSRVETEIPSDGEDGDDREDGSGDAPG